MVLAGEEKEKSTLSHVLKGDEWATGRSGYDCGCNSWSPLRNGVVLFKKELIRLWNSILPEPEQPSAQLSKLIRLTACKKTKHTVRGWYRTVSNPWLVASYGTNKGKRWLNSSPPKQQGKIYLFIYLFVYIVKLYFLLSCATYIYSRCNRCYFYFLVLLVCLNGLDVLDSLQFCCSNWTQGHCCSGSLSVVCCTAALVQWLDSGALLLLCIASTLLHCCTGALVHCCSCSLVYTLSGRTGSALIWHSEGNTIEALSVQWVLRFAAQPALQCAIHWA